jgi:hypothetical protein
MRFKGKPKLRRPREDSRGCGIDSSGEGRNEIGETYTEGRVFKTETGKVANGRDIPDAAAIRPANASGDVDLLLKRPGSNLHIKKDENDTSMRSWGSCDTARFTLEARR